MQKKYIKKTLYWDALTEKKLKRIRRERKGQSDSLIIRNLIASV